jgi:hypothetical protein
MSRRYFVGQVSLKVEGELLDADGNRVTPVELHFHGDIKAQHGMDAHDLLSGWIVRQINGQDVLLASYDDRLLQSLVRLLDRATDPKHPLHEPIRNLLLKVDHGPEEGQTLGRKSYRRGVRQPADDRMPGALSRKLPSRGRLGD